CKAALEEAGKRFNALKGLPLSEASPDLVQRTMARISEDTGRNARSRLVWRRRAWWIGAAAGFLFLCLHIHYSTMAPAPYDLRVIGQSKLHAGTRQSLRVEVVNPGRGAGLADIPVTLEMRDPVKDEWIQLATFQTDAQGTGQPSLQLPDWKDGAYDLRV